MFACEPIIIYMNNQSDLLFVIKHFSKCIEMKVDKETEKLGLTPQQARILFYLVRHEDEHVKQVDIKEHFHLSKSTVSGLIKRLENKNLVIKEDNYLRASDKAKEMRSLYKFNINEMTDKIFPELNQEQKDRLSEILKEKINLMEGNK